MNGWRDIKLKEVSEYVTVGFVGSMADQYVEAGVPFLRSLNIHPFRLNYNDLKYIPESFHDAIKKSKLRPGDVAIVRTGYPGTACVIPADLPDANCSDLVILRPGPDLNPHYIAAVFNSSFGQSLVGGNLVGAAQQHFNVTVAKELKLRLPPRAEQDKIAAVLVGLNDLIANNQRRIALLESMAEEIYSEWFVRMRFPGADRASFAKSPPLGWERKNLREVAEIDPLERRRIGEPAPFVPMDRLSTQSMCFDADEIRSDWAGAKFRNHDVLLPRITPSLENGKRGYVLCLKDDEVGVGSTEFIVLRAKKISPEHLYFLSISDGFRKHAELSMSGASGRQRVQDDCFSFFLVAVPPPGVTEAFVQVVRPMFKQVFNLVEQNKRLSAQRDALLPRLISGKLRVEALDIQLPPSMQPPSEVA
jgi:type I restriction enzyme S subunit